MWSGTDNTNFQWAGDDISTKQFINQEAISPGYLATMGLKIKEGRDFYPNAVADTQSVLINESLARIMGKAGKVGSQVIPGIGQHPMTIVGIVQNFVFADMYATPAPAVFLCDPSVYQYCYSLDLRLKPGVKIPAAVDKISAVIKAENPGYPVEVKFVDAEFQHRFESETRIGELAGASSQPWRSSSPASASSASPPIPPSSAQRSWASAKSSAPPSPVSPASYPGNSSSWCSSPV
jgi:putative ABC transport system permease protein